MANDVVKSALTLVSNTSVPSAVKNQQADQNPAGKIQADTATAAPEKIEATRSTPVIDDTVERLNEIVQTVERNLQFSIDKQSGDAIIKVIDKKTQEVIRQIPSEEVMAIRNNIEELKGIIFSAEV